MNPRLTARLQVVLASLLMLATLPGRTQGLGLVTEPLLADLHLDRVIYANMNLWATLAGALFCFPTGWAIDRLGLRWVTAGMVLLLGLTVWQLSATTASIALIFTLLLATRAFGQSALSVCSITTVGKWFPERAGFAMGMYSVLISVLFAAAFGVVGYSVRVHGWRSAWQQIALALLCVILPLVLLALRQPDASPDPAPAEKPVSTSADLTLSQAIQTGAFWLFAGAAAGFNLVSSGLGLFNEAVLAEHGFDQKTFHVFLAVTSLLSLAGQFLCGWLTRRYRHQTLMGLALLVYAVSLAAIPMLIQKWQLWVLAVLIGVAGGMIIVVFFSVWSDLFGQRHLGRIQGAAQMLTVISSGVGPVLFAGCFERSGSYSPLLFALAAVSVVLALFVAVVRNPARSPAGLSPHEAGASA